MNNNDSLTIYSLELNTFSATKDYHDKNKSNFDEMMIMIDVCFVQYQNAKLNF
jgi:hypothetical protein